MWTIAWYEMLRQLRLRPVQIMLFVMPLIIIYILGTALSGLFDESPAAVSRLRLVYGPGNGAAGLTERLHAPFYTDRLRGEQKQTDEEVLEAVRKGQADIGILFDRASEPELVLGRNPDRNEAGRLMADALLTGTTPPGSAASEYVSTGPAKHVYAGLTGLQYYSASMLVMYLLYAGMGGAIGFADARKNGTLERLLAQPLRRNAVISGYCLGGAAISAVQTLLIIAGSRLLFGVSWGGSYVVPLLACLLTIGCCMALTALAARLIRSRQTVQLLFQWLIVMMTLLSGGYNPQLQEAFGSLYRYTFNYWPMTSMLTLMAGGSAGEALRALGPEAALLAVLGIAVFVVYRRRWDI